MKKKRIKIPTSLIRLAWPSPSIFVKTYELEFNEKTGSCVWIRDGVANGIDFHVDDFLIKETHDGNLHYTTIIYMIIKNGGKVPNLINLL